MFHSAGFKGKLTGITPLFLGTYSQVLPLWRSPPFSHEKSGALKSNALWLDSGGVHSQSGNHGRITPSNDCMIRWHSQDDLHSINNFHPRLPSTGSKAEVITRKPLH